MEDNTLKVSIGIDFSLIGTQSHAMYEKNEGGYIVLLIPSKQTPGNGISVEDPIDDIKNMARGVTGNDTVADMTQLRRAVTGIVKESGSTSMRLGGVVIRLQMAYLCICERGENSVLEYALQLRVVTEGLVPETAKPIVDVTNLSISVWNMDREKVMDKTVLTTVDEYLSVAVLSDKSQAAK